MENQPLVVVVQQQPITLYDQTNPTLDKLHECGYGGLLDIISAPTTSESNKELNERILTSTTYTGDQGIIQLHKNHLPTTTNITTPPCVARSTV
jgi:hypothetical protein